MVPAREREYTFLVAVELAYPSRATDRLADRQGAVAVNLTARLASAGDGFRHPVAVKVASARYLGPALTTVPAVSSVR